MVSLLTRLFIENSEDVRNPATRQAYGMLSGALGIGFNVLLCAAKFVVGAVSNSIAITADALNNLSDAGTSVITLIGFKLAGKRADTDHPYGHGRIEYIAGLIVSFFIVLVGVELAKSSLDKVLHPSFAAPNAFTFIVLALSVLIKFYMFVYNRAIAKKVDSAAIDATAADSLSDALITAAVLACMALARFTHIQADGYCGLLISLFILYAGFKAAVSVINPLLGQPPKKEFVQQIEAIVMSQPPIVGVHDLMVHDYGPGRLVISLHAEVPATADILVAHDAVDNVEKRLRRDLNCVAVIHMDPIATDDEQTAILHKKISEAVKAIDPSITLHDFRIVQGPSHTNVIFDAVVPYASKLADDEVKKRIASLVSVIDDTLYAVVDIDRDYAQQEV
ncbi:MAG: cation diffusion facilitator family transporter [Eubacteriales bacterium]|nr:cation diffusion facilitator family transporter [Eubacteriales bacterium]